MRGGDRAKHVLRDIRVVGRREGRFHPHRQTPLATTPGREGPGRGWWFDASTKRCELEEGGLPVVLLVRAGAARLPGGDELEPARMDCLRVAAVCGVERVDGAA